MTVVARHPCEAIPATAVIARDVVPKQSSGEDALRGHPCTGLLRPLKGARNDVAESLIRYEE
jgi:hypothetical protein